MKSKSTLKPILVALPLLVVVLLFTTCNKKPVGEITVTTKDISNITGNSATTGGTVTSSGYTVSECGVCYSEYSYPSTGDSRTKDQEGNGSFNSTLSDLKAGTTYHVRAYAKTSSGVEYGDEMVFTTTGNNTINVFASPTAGGTVTGAGAYQTGQTCTVTATAKEGYTFTNWTENGTAVSDNESYSFTVTGNRNLQANFSLNTFNITVTANPSDGGTISGGGEYGYGKSCTVTAEPYPVSTFINWTENGEVVSTNTSYTFTVTSDRTLVANFTVPTGNWLYYGNDTIETIWGYTDGGTMEWAVLYPAELLGPYVGMNITETMIYSGTGDRYYLTIYTGETTPTTVLYSDYYDIPQEGWWKLLYDTPFNITGQNLWVSITNTHEAGTYPAGASKGSNNPNARWINLGTDGWCDAYLDGWCDEDLTWIIYVFVTNEDKSCKFELKTQERPMPYGKQRPTKQKGVLQRSR